MIMILRHAEKPTKGNDEHGIRPNGEHDKHSLTVRGWTRAGALVGLFAPEHGDPRPGLARPDAIFASGHVENGGHRPVQTVIPLADRLRLPIIKKWKEGAEAELAAALAARRDTVLVSWQHETIPKIVRALGPVTPAVPDEWPDDRFDVVWTATRTGSTWRFAQVPQLLLAGDLPHPIT